MGVVVLGTALDGAVFVDGARGEVRRVRRGELVVQPCTLAGEAAVPEPGRHATRQIPLAGLGLQAPLQVCGSVDSRGQLGAVHGVQRLGNLVAELREGGEPLEHPLLKILFEGTEEDHKALRAFYVHAAKFHELKRKQQRHEKQRQKRLDQQAKKQAQQSASPAA